MTEAPLGARIVIISPRSSSSTDTATSPLDLACDPEDVCWVDVSSDQLGSLFSLE